MVLRSETWHRRGAATPVSEFELRPTAPARPRHTFGFRHPPRRPTTLAHLVGRSNRVAARRHRGSAGGDAFVARMAHVLDVEGWCTCSRRLERASSPALYRAWLFRSRGDVHSLFLMHAQVIVPLATCCSAPGGGVGDFTSRPACGRGRVGQLGQSFTTWWRICRAATPRSKRGCRRRPNSWRDQGAEVLYNTTRTLAGIRSRSDARRVMRDIERVIGIKGAQSARRGKRPARRPSPCTPHEQAKSWCQTGTLLRCFGAGAAESARRIVGDGRSACSVPFPRAGKPMA